MSPLRRSITLVPLTLYGLGTILGAGIYVLVGKVSGHAGLLAPAAFALSALLAGLTGLSFAELSARFPRSAGEAVYVSEAFGSPRLSTGVGLAIALSGVASAATMCVGVSGYVSLLIDVPSWLTIVVLLGVLGGLTAWGLQASVTVAAAMTILEVAGLFYVLWAARGALTQLPDRAVDVLVPATQPEWAGVLLGSFIAFYAFIGFEDMVNTAEEVVRPQRTLPLAITLALGLSLVLYTLVAAACVLSLPSEVLAASDAPLADVVRAHTGTDPVVLGWISLVAVVNGALVQLVMASRVLYGLAREGWLPASLARVHPTRETPIRATAWVVGAVAVLALTSPVETLAEITSVLLLCVFALVNVALFVVKGTAPDSPFRLPRALPLVGASVILAFLAFRLYEAII